MNTSRLLTATRRVFMVQCHNNKINSRFGPCMYSSAAAVNPAGKDDPPIAVSQPLGKEKSYDPKLVKLVQDISQLTLIEVADLNELLKKTLNIPDTPMMGAMNFSPMAGAGAAADEEEEVVPQKVQTSFTLKLIKYDDAKKVPLIKECKSLLEGMNLVQAKKFVESAPCIIKADITKEDAEKLQKALEAVGATCELS